MHNLTALDLQYWTHHLTIIKERQEIHVSVEQDGEPAGWHFEGQRLNPVDVVRVVADNPRHARLSDLVQLSQGECSSLVDAKVVEELVSFLQPGKLVANDTLEHRTKDWVFVSSLEETAKIEVNVVHRLVDAPNNGTN